MKKTNPKQTQIEKSKNNQQIIKQNQIQKWKKSKKNQKRIKSWTFGDFLDFQETTKDLIFFWFFFDFFHFWIWFFLIIFCFFLIFQFESVLDLFFSFDYFLMFFWFLIKTLISAFWEEFPLITLNGFKQHIWHWVVVMRRHHVPSTCADHHKNTNSPTLKH